MILPEEERLWIEKYREAMDARLAEESRWSIIRMAWSRITSPGSASQAIPRRESVASAKESPTWPSKPTLSAADGFMNEASPQQEKKSVSSSADDEAQCAL
jgi:hypothetical protein